MCPYQAEFIFFGALPSTFLLKPLSRSPSVHSSHSQDHCRLHTYRSMQSLPLRLKEKHKETCTHVGTTKNIALSASMQRACERTETSVREACGTPVCEDHTTHVQLLLRMDGSSTSVSNALSLIGELCCHRSFDTLLLSPRSWRLERGLTRALQRHDASTHSVPHRRENKWSSGFQWMLAVRAAQIQEAFFAFDGNGTTASATAVPVLSGSSASSSSSWRMSSVSSGGSAFFISVS